MCCALCVPILSFKVFHPPRIEIRVLRACLVPFVSGPIVSDSAPEGFRSISLANGTPTATQIRSCEKSLSWPVYLHGMSAVGISSATGLSTCQAFEHYIALFPRQKPLSLGLINLLLCLDTAVTSSSSIESGFVFPKIQPKVEKRP